MSVTLFSYRIVYDSITVYILVTSITDPVQVHVLLAAVRNLPAVILCS